MKNNTFKVFGIIAILAVFALSAATCFNQSSGGGKSFNNPEALKEYLDKQPVNGPDKPIKVTMIVNDPMLNSVANVIKSAGKYVSLNLSGNALTSIPNNTFRGCETLVSITIPDSVTEIEGQRTGDDYEQGAFYGCDNLTSVTIGSSVTSIGINAFPFLKKLTSITFKGTVTSFGRSNYRYNKIFDGDLQEKYEAGGIGTYTTTAPVDYWDSIWTKQ